MFEHEPGRDADGAPGLAWDAPAPTSAPTQAEEWAWPGRPEQPVSPEPDACAQRLVEAVDALLAQDVAALAPAVARERTRTVLAQGERLGVAIGTAVLDVQARELHVAEHARSAGVWLSRQVGGDGGRLSRAARMAAHPRLRAAVATGALGLAPADTAAKALDRLPQTTADGQVEGVLLNAVPQLLERWVAGPVTEADPGDELAAARAAVVQEAIAEGLEATLATPADRLEPAFALLAQALAPSVLADQLELLVDALAPERLADAEQRAYDERGLRLWKKRGGPGFGVAGDLTDEVGQGLYAELQARAQARRQAQAALRTAAQDGTTGPEFGTAGPGTTGPAARGHGEPGEEQPAPSLTDAQLNHDLLGQVLVDLQGVRQPGTPRPAALTIRAGLDTLEGRLGAVPGTVFLAGRPAPISLEALRRAGCDSVLSAVLVDAAGRPVGASGSHRHATERERRALREIWGDYCAEDGCGGTDLVPHHVKPYWLTGRTALADLVPVCTGTHHAVHDGHQTIRLRDGRLINELGWVTGADPPPRGAGQRVWAVPPDPYPAEPVRRWAPFGDPSPPS